MAPLPPCPRAEMWEDLEVVKREDDRPLAAGLSTGSTAVPVEAEDVNALVDGLQGNGSHRAILLGEAKSG